LGLKPMLTFNAKGGLDVIAKISGKKKAIRTLADKVINELSDTDKPVYIVDADCPADDDMLESLVKEKRPEAKIVRQVVGTVIGAHCGPGTMGVIFAAEKRPIALLPQEE